MVSAVMFSRSIFISLLRVFCVLVCVGSLSTLAYPQNNKVSLVGNFIEGGMVVGQTEPGAVVTLDDLPIPINKGGRFVLGFHRDSPDTMLLRVILPDQAVYENRLQITNRTYDVQAIDTLAHKYVTPDPSAIQRIKDDAEMVRRAREKLSTQEDFTAEWIWPATGIITGVYGSQRILNGQPSTPHYGIDIAMPEGTLVMTPASGTITLVADLYYSGLTMMIDHGMGIYSTLLHLRDSLVAEGDRVNVGQFIALSGNSGRSTGPHLDWRVNWGNHARLDASLLVSAMPDVDTSKANAPVLNINTELTQEHVDIRK